jgi:hypothetical protein
MVELFEETLDESPRDEEVMQQLEFTTKTLGRLDVPDTVLPVLLNVATTPGPSSSESARGSRQSSLPPARLPPTRPGRPPSKRRS